MVSYDEVKTKIQNFRKTVLADMSYKRAERAKTLFDSVNATVKYILEQLSAALSAKVDLNVDNYAAQLYYLSPVTAIGERKVAVDYNDDTTTINGRTVIPFDTFTYDPTLYAENVKSFADALSRRLVVARVPNSESPPSGDFEDVSYTYYTAEAYYSGVSEVIDIYNLTGQYGTLEEMAEFDLYGWEAVYNYVRMVKGVFDSFNYSIGGNSVFVDIGSGGVLVLTEDSGTKFKRIAYKFTTFINNQTDYTVEIVVGNKPHKCEANTYACYVYLTDIHLKATPIRIL